MKLKQNIHQILTQIFLKTYQDIICTYNIHEKFKTNYSFVKQMLLIIFKDFKKG